jgi:4-methylaminobutanoate oxidase (formaldehyde-forming)
MLTRVQVVVIGSGIAGSSIAYHLTELGWRNVLVLEQGNLISGTTSHPPGLVGQMRSSPALIKLLMDSVSLYRSLRVDGKPGYFPTGSLRLASSQARLEEITRQHRLARQTGLEAELLSPQQAAKLFPLMTLEGVEGALYLPTDGSATPVILAQALADRARANGAVFEPQTTVTGFETESGRVRAVLTSRGRVETEVAVIAAGIWSPRLGRMAGVTIPLLPMQHQFAVTEPWSELSANSAVANMRDPDNLVYFRQDGEALVLGGYEHSPKSWPVDTIPTGNNPTVLPFDPPRFQQLLDGAHRRVPALRGKKFQRQVNGLESFTPDGAFIVGETVEVGGLWVACGFCAHGISGSGGVGKALAEWIVSGRPQADLSEMDIRRFSTKRWSPAEVAERTFAVYRNYYGLQTSQEPV